VITRPLRVTLVLLGTSALLAGCGGEPAAVRDKDAVLRLKLDEYSIGPQAVSVLATSIPMPIKIVARNVGRLTHNVKVVRVGVGANPDEAAVLGRPTPIGGTPTAQPGQTVRTTDAILLAPGKYRLTDTIGNHDNLGQFGFLTIVTPLPAR